MAITQRPPAPGMEDSVEESGILGQEMCPVPGTELTSVSWESYQAKAKSRSHVIPVLVIPTQRQFLGFMKEELST